MNRALIVLGLVLMLVSVFGCASMDRIYDESRWRYDGMETATYTWQEGEHFKAACGHFASNVINWGCAVRIMDSVQVVGANPVPGAKVSTGHCYILSNVSEEDAKRIGTTTGDDLWSHELRHCNGYRH